MEIAMAVIGLLATGFGALALFQISTMQKDNKDIWKTTQKLNDDFAFFRTHVAENYVKNTRLEQMEERLMDKLDRIEKRIYGGDD